MTSNAILNWSYVLVQAIWLSIFFLKDIETSRLSQAAVGFNALCGTVAVVAIVLCVRDRLRVRR